MALTKLAPKCIALLVKHFGHDINSKDALGDTFLHRLIRFGSQVSKYRKGKVVKTARALLECGIDTSAVNIDGFSALMLSAALESNLFPLLVMSDKVGPNIQTEGGTALLYAARLGDARYVEMLLEREDILPEIGLPSGFCPLHEAACQGRAEIAELLLADPKRAKRIADCEDRNGVTPLSAAARSGHLKIVKMLVETGFVEVDHPDANGRTPLSNAAECAAWNYNALLDIIKKRDYTGIVAFLCNQEGVDINRRDIAGCTPLDWAFESLSRRKQSVGRASNGKDLHPPLESANTKIVRDETNGRVSPGLELQLLNSSCLELELRSRTKIVGILISHGSFLTPEGPPSSNERDFWDGCELESGRHYWPRTESERSDSDFLGSEFSLSDAESTTSKAPPEGPEPSSVEEEDNNTT
jgi:ankyrin repeat protein